ncbi:MAG: methyltransferase domain-containing protein [Longimonas sp.]|uniref:class I SAM-dependent methyltransferase n=1 Tax=Longimonas sp. TaxID=2039626 RepID=UPI003975642B
MTCRDYVLRTLASVPVDRYVLVLGCTDGHYTAPLLRLGFPVHACSAHPEAVHATRTAIADLMEDPAEAAECVQRCTPTLDAYPDSVFDWVVAPHLNTYAEAPPERAFDAVQRVLKPGGWTVLGLEPSAVPAGNEETPNWPATRASLIVRAQEHHFAEAACPDDDTDDASASHIYQLFRRER